MSKFQEAVLKEVRAKLRGEGHDFLNMVARVFDLNSQQIGAMFDPPKSKHTINGYRREKYTDLGQDGKEQVMDFVAAWYRGPKPLASLKAKIKRNLRRDR